MELEHPQSTPRDCLKIQPLWQKVIWLIWEQIYQNDPTSNHLKIWPLWQPKKSFDANWSVLTLTGLLQFKNNNVIVDLRFVVVYKCHHEKNRCADVTVEAISLSTTLIVLIALHFCCVYANLLIFVLTLSPPLQTLPLTHTLCLSLH